MEPSRSLSRGKLRDCLREMYPGVPDGDFTLHRTLRCSGGQTRHGDVVVCRYDGALQIGELLLSVSIASMQPPKIHCLVALWIARSAIGPANTDWCQFSIPNDGTLAHLTSDDILGSLTYRPADDGNTALAHIPFEYRSEPAA